MKTDVKESIKQAIEELPDDEVAQVLEFIKEINPGLKLNHGKLATTKRKSYIAEGRRQRAEGRRKTLTIIKF
ncbi:MAG: hypothetical protein DSM107014_05575 [Gomphosphaeria aponina SAG 52.96 = DSM 107014]|uniref:DUF2281 domain-containing protein n=1 Tax=Gomphosphaeria aponina SAG 52.96 = DSM 107014 TaxID=1521640 RepID=A0A941JUR0_9CHRO|nr:hypothetical protein [Gomphosphaeria aponina SAG 52.96 = DSM 107014]